MSPEEATKAGMAEFDRCRQLEAQHPVLKELREKEEKEALAEAAAWVAQVKGGG